MTAKKYIKKWHEVIKNNQLELLDDLLHDSVVFLSPVVFSPLEGKDMTKMYLYAAGKSFNMKSFKYTRQLNDNLNSVLEFETEIDGISVNGVDMIEWTPEGKIINFKVMIRPYKGVEIVKQKMSEMLEALK